MPRGWACGAVISCFQASGEGGKAIGRELAWAISCIGPAHGEDLNGWMVANGWAVAYREFTRDYIPAGERAHAAQLGLWRGDFMLPSQWRRQQGQ